MIAAGAKKGRKKDAASEKKPKVSKEKAFTAQCLQLALECRCPVRDGLVAKLREGIKRKRPEYNPQDGDAGRLARTQVPGHLLRRWKLGCFFGAGKPFLRGI